MKFFRQYIQPAIAILLLTELAIAVAIFVLMAKFVVAVPVEALPYAGAVWVWALVYAVFVILSLTAMGLYHARQRLRIREALTRVVVAMLATSVALWVFDLIVLWPDSVPFWVNVIGFTFLLLAIDRMVFLSFVDDNVFRRRVVILGAGDRAASVLSLRRRSDQRGFVIVAFLPSPGDTTVIKDSRVVNPETSLLRFASENDVQEIVVAMDDRRQSFPTRELLQCKFAGIDVVDLMGFLERETGKLKVDLAKPSWLIFSDGFSMHPIQQATARVIDLAAAILLLVLTAPIMLVVALAIMLDDGRPVLYRQSRVGLRGSVFTLYKFRSMIRNAETNGQAVWADKTDSRVTKVGRTLRKLRLDELPQLFNVIRGEMSLVGPRPERPEFVEQLAQKIPYYHERHSVKPGITGWAQLRYPYGSSENDAMEKLQYDLYYVKHRSLIFDLMVLLQTIEVVLWGKGAR